MQPIADYLGVTVEEVATQILTRAYEKISPVILELADKYKLEHDQISLVGCRWRCHLSDRFLCTEDEHQLQRS